MRQHRGAGEEPAAGPSALPTSEGLQPLRHNLLGKMPFLLLLCPLCGDTGPPAAHRRFSQGCLREQVWPCLGVHVRGAAEAPAVAPLQDA